MRTTKVNVIHIEDGEEVEVRYSTAHAELAVRLRAVEGETMGRIEVQSDHVVWLQNTKAFVDDFPDNISVSEEGVTLHIV